MLIPYVTLRSKKIVEIDELERYESGPLWIMDEDFRSGKELNFRRYDDLSGLYEIYLDGEFRHEDDIADAITGGATMVTVYGDMDKEKLRKVLFYTDSVILSVKNGNGNADFFLQSGGTSIYSDSFIFHEALRQYSRVLRCERCTIIVPIGDYNAGRDKETSAIP